MDPVELVTPRLRLRLPDARDTDAVTAACQDPEVQRWVPVPSPYAREHAEQWIAGAAESWARDEELRFVVVDRTGDSLVGAMGLHARSPGMREIGFWTAPGARRRGFTVEAARRICRWGFEDLGLHRVEWLALVGNEGSRAVAQRAGFVLEGTLRHGILHRGTPCDAWIAGLLPGDPS